MNDAPARLEEAPEAAHPDCTDPMLAVLTDARFSDENWIFERKLDGERVLIFRDGDRIRLMSRNRKCLNDTYPDLVEALLEQDAKDFVADGEVVAFDGSVTDFSTLQGRMKIKDPEEARASDIEVFLYVFDLLHLEGRDLTGLPLRERKAALGDALSFSDPVRYTQHRNAEGEAYYREACEKGWEGVIAKRADAPYHHGRSRDWLKFKCEHGQELVIGGFTDPKGSRKGFGALLVGYYEDGVLRYAGKVGTGYDDEFLAEFREELDAHERKTCPFADEVDEQAHWVSPDFVAEIGFTEWTTHGRLRHPRFLGLRRDKAPEDVIRERPEGA